MATAQERIQHGIRQRERILDFIVSYREDNGFSPSWKEIGEAVNLTARAVQGHLEKLEEEGRIEIIPGKARAIRVNW